MRNRIAHVFRQETRSFSAAAAFVCLGLFVPTSAALAAETVSEVKCAVGMNVATSVVDADSLARCVQSLRAQGDVTGLEVVGLAPMGQSRVSKLRTSEEHASLVAAKLSLEFPGAVVNAKGTAGRVATAERAVLVTGYTSQKVTRVVAPPQGAEGPERVVTLSKPDTSAVRTEWTLDDGLYEEEVALGRVAYSTEPEIASERHPSYTSTANVDDTSF